MITAILYLRYATGSLIYVSTEAISAATDKSASYGNTIYWRN
jgi:hypothetical protein